MAENMKPPFVRISRGVYCDHDESCRSPHLPSRDRNLLVKLMVANIDRISELFLNRHRYLTDETIARLEEAERRRKLKILMSMRNS